MEANVKLLHGDYTVGWICALPTELTIAEAMLDKKHLSLPMDSRDSNIYTLGRIRDHNVVIACLPAGQTGTVSAAIVAVHMKYSFRNIRFALMVGVGGGVPSTDHDIRMGDVIVSVPGKKNGGVIQHDFGRMDARRQFEHTGAVDSPPAIVLSAASKLSARIRNGHRLTTYLSSINNPEFHYQGVEEDILFRTDYNHIESESSCKECNRNMAISRAPRPGVPEPQVHLGTIASGNLVMRDAETRDQWRDSAGVLCFEMEGAGLMKVFPCLVIRGICDYADSHKNKKWQGYAAATAAAYAKGLLDTIPPWQVQEIANQAGTMGAALKLSDCSVTGTWTALSLAEVNSRLETLYLTRRQRLGPLNWSESIVDLLKLLGMECHLDARDLLAQKLNVHVGERGNAVRNIALRKSMLEVLGRNDCNIPPSLCDLLL